VRHTDRCLSSNVNQAFLILPCHELGCPVKSPAGTADNHPCPKWNDEGTFGFRLLTTVYGSGRVPQVRQAYSGFPVDLPCVDELHAAFLNESRTRGRWWRPVAGNADTWAENGVFQCFHSMYQGSRSGQLPFARRVGTIEGAAPWLGLSRPFCTPMAPIDFQLAYVVAPRLYRMAARLSGKWAVETVTAPKRS
jgi:hypothetical protein